MKLSPALKEGLEFLKKHQVLYRRKDIGTPYNYVIEERRNMETDKYCRKFKDGESIWTKSVNAQTINRLVLLGYAKFEDKKEIVKYVDRVKTAIEFLESKGYKVIRCSEQD